MNKRLQRAGLAGLILGAAALPALAQQTASPLPRDRLNLSATASVEVARDTLGVVFSTSKDGSNAAAVQLALKQALDAALAEAKKIAKPGQVEVQTGNFSLYPRYGSKNGQTYINGWQGSAELVVEGKNISAISELTGRIGSMSIARVGYSLSKEAREQQESAVVAQAIAQFKARASDYVKQFGFSAYDIGEVSVSTQDAGPVPMAAPSLRMKAAGAVLDEALPVETGKATVSVSVNGSVVMKR
ncbi:MAG TPA: SIMPL domain-containing protein [Burkholderiaceae bacterium]|nr:SIMPL domain-containing protein [Burkholderiaceae bacterium]